MVGVLKNCNKREVKVIESSQFVFQTFRFVLLAVCVRYFLMCVHVVRIKFQTMLLTSNSRLLRKRQPCLHSSIMFYLFKTEPVCFILFSGPIMSHCWPFALGCGYGGRMLLPSNSRWPCSHKSWVRR